MTSDFSHELEDSLTALKGRFNLGKAEQRGNPAQLVLLAEHAIKVKRLDISAECIQLFFKLDPPLNQFYCRALFCKAQYTCPSLCHDTEKLNEATNYLLKAIAVAKKSKIYHFLVFNASVHMWQIVRPYQRSGYRHIIARPLANVVKALDEVNEQDYKWRLELMTSLVHCYLDSGHKEDATRVSNSAMTLAKKHCSDKLIDIFKLQLYYHLGDAKQLEKIAKSSDHYLSIYKVFKLKCDVRKQMASGHVVQSELTEKLRKVLDILTGNAPNTQSSLKNISVASSAPSTPQSVMTSDDKASLFADVCQLAMEHHCISIAAQCITSIPYDVQGSVLLLRIEFLRCQLMVKSVEKDNQTEMYSKAAVETRLKAIRRMEDALASAARLSEHEITEAGCVIQWNLCLPLLQHNLRHYISKHLLTIAQIMEKIDSLLVKMRCQLHTEVAKCLADEDHLTAAIEHLDKAIQLDELGEYQEQLLHARQRLVLKGQLYTTPEDSLQQAAQIIEQISTGASLAKHAHALLVKAGTFIAPDTFAEAIGSTSQNDPKSSSATPYLVTLADKAKQYVFTKERVSNHKKLVGTERDKERFKLWADLSKLTRKLEVWDIAIVASAFCLLYDDGRWEGDMVQASSGNLSDKSLHSKSSKLTVQKSSVQRIDSSVQKSTPSPSDVDVKVSFSDSSSISQQREIYLLRTMAEIHFINAECLVHALKMDDILLGDKPSLPAEGKVKDRKFDPDTDTDWKSYCEWVKEVTVDARNGFVRAAELGGKLNEQWLISNAVVYLWNYSQHILISPTRHVELVDSFRPILNTIKTTTLQGEAQLVCELCSVLASGLMVPWIPKINNAATSASPTKGKKRASSTKKNKMSGNLLQLEVDPSGIPCLREALEVCQYAMSIYHGVTLSVRQPIINTWVETKQLLKESINKNMGHDHEDDPSCGECRSLVAVKMTSLQGNMIGDFTQCPTLQESYDLASGCQWSDPLLQLELWSQLSNLALKQQDYNLVSKCCDKALEFVDTNKEDINIKLSNEKRGWELLSIAASIKAQKLAATAQGNVAVVKESQMSFIISARFGQKASSYSQVMDACRHYWNTCQTGITSIAGRAVLLDQLVELLQILSTLSSRRAIKTDAGATTGGNTENEIAEQMTALGLTNEEDLSLRVSMYSVVLQIHTDMQDWQGGLKAVEDAMWVMPRSHHKELAKYKIVFKSKLGRNVEADMVRFHEEAENFKASLWHLSAINATDTNEELLGHQRAIEMLRSADHQWQKIEYLIAFGEWIYWKQLPSEDAINQFEHAIDILLSMPPIVRKAETPEKPLTSNKSPQAKTTSNKSLNQSTEEVDDNKESTNGVSAINNMKKLEYLAHLHVMIATVYGERDERSLQHFMASLGYVMLIWKNLYNIIAQESHTDLKSLIPATLEQWACLELNDEMIDPLKSETDEQSLNEISLPKPILTLHFLQLLTDGLCSNDLYHLSVPVLALQLFISKEILHHSATVKLVHLRLLNLCQQLQLMSCVKYLESKLAESHLLSPHDISKSREEIACYQIEQKMISMATGKKKVRVSGQWKTQRPRELSNQPCLRTVWVEQAHLLIKQGQYQVAREMLNEAQLSSEIFEDQHTLCVVFYTQALLAYHEKNMSDMKKLLLDAQKLPAVGRMWLASCELWYETFLNTNIKEQLVAKSMLWHAMSVFNELKEERHSEEEFVNHAVTILKCWLASFEIHQIISSPAKHNKRSINDIQASCEILEASSSLLLNKGLLKEAVNIILLHADTISKMTDNNNHRSYLLKTISLYKQALEILKERSEAIYGLSHSSMLQAVSSPVQRSMISVQVKLASLLINVSLEDLKDQQQQQHASSRRCIEQLIDDFVKSGPSLSTSEKEWQSVVKMSFENALALLISAYHTVTNIPELKPQVCYQAGRCLYLIALRKGPDREMQWNRELMSAISTSLKSDTRDENKLNPLDHYSALSRVMRKDSANKAEESEAIALQYISLANRSLAEAVKYGLENEDIVLVSDAALKLVEYCGYYDIEMTCQYLALYQSCVASLELRQLLLQAQSDASSSQLASLLHQRTMLRDHPHSSTFIANTHLLNKKYEAWRRQCVSQNHLEFIKNFPPHFRIVILQHSPDKSTLYGAVLYPTQPPSTAGSGKAKGQAVNPPLKTVLTSCSVSASDLKSIQELMDYYRTDLTQALIRHERILQVTLHQIKLIGKDKCASENLQEVTPEMCACLQEETRLQSYFEDILTAVEAYLQPVTETIKDALNFEPNSKELDVVLLVDSDLMELPLESLAVFHNLRIRSVSRDFSLQMLHERMKAHLTESTNDSLAGGDKKKSADKSTIQPPTVLADVTNIKYVIDPSNDCISSAYNEVCGKLIHDVTSEIQSHAKFTSKWSGIQCPETRPTHGEWYSLLKKCSGLMFYGAEHFLSYFPPDHLAPLSIVGCSVVVLLDRVQTQESFLRQSKQNTQKSFVQLTLEQPTNTARLLSLVGPSCIVINQCCTQFQKNVDIFKKLLKGCLDEGKPIARALWQKEHDNEKCKEVLASEGKVIETDEIISAAGTDVNAKSRSSYSNFRNTIVYGLPHITLSPST